jgi:uncharacterized metal-binding protein
MPDLPKKKVGIIACSGEELPEGTVTRLAALKVLKESRPDSTVTICLPLFLAGGEGDRAFARYYPTIAVDGCEKRCAAKGTEMYSGKPAASVVVTDVLAEGEALGSARRLTDAGMAAVDAVADQITGAVDTLLGQQWDRQRGGPVQVIEPEAAPTSKVATCSCGSNIPVQVIRMDGREVSLAGLPLIFAQFQQNGKLPNEDARTELIQSVKIYNPIPKEAEADYAAAVLQAYAAFCDEEQEAR